MVVLGQMTRLCPDRPHKPWAQDFLSTQPVDPSAIRILILILILILLLVIIIMTTIIVTTIIQIIGKGLLQDLVLHDAVDNVGVEGLLDNHPMISLFVVLLVFLFYWLSLFMFNHWLLLLISFILGSFSYSMCVTFCRKAEPGGQTGLGVQGSGKSR